VVCLLSVALGTKNLSPAIVVQRAVPVGPRDTATDLFQDRSKATPGRIFHPRGRRRGGGRGRGGPPRPEQGLADPPRPHGRGRELSAQDYFTKMGGYLTSHP
jgi:hypothetical protein